MTVDTFAALDLSGRLLRALEDADYKTPTPIQAKAIPLLLDGYDLLGIAQTGTGKTAAFTLPLLHNLEEDNERPRPRCARALILAPTRELAIQISESIKTYGRHMRMRHRVVMGGVGKRPQADALKRGVDILVATPGRLIDLLNGGHLDLGACEYLVVDEADRMLDMGFIRDVRRIVAKLPDERQTLLFSATMPAEIARLAREILFEPERVEIAARSIAVERIDQHVHHLDRSAKSARLKHLLRTPDFERVIVFTRTKRGADRVVKQLGRGGVTAEALHGNKSQNARQRALDNFREGRSRVLVATDIAARGIDIDGVTHVINYEMPNEPESYVHRIGRTARAGAQGIAISFCDPSERKNLHSIERLIKRPLTVSGENMPDGQPKLGAGARNGESRRRRGRRRGGHGRTADRSARWQ
ncbi:MAG: DEAD/DEAH box helicase [Hyphomicrobiaceae bacterium]|nr:DEAD/DEAH box helicase [Hyphomicrobiaceae bacterium]